VFNLIVYYILLYLKVRDYLCKEVPLTHQLDHIKEH